MDMNSLITTTQAFASSQTFWPINLIIAAIIAIVIIITIMIIIATAIAAIIAVVIVVVLLLLLLLLLLVTYWRGTQVETAHTRQWLRLRRPSRMVS